jgi:hypothetical protein
MLVVFHSDAFLDIPQRQALLRQKHRSESKPGRRKYLMQLVQGVGGVIDEQELIALVRDCY